MILDILAILVLCSAGIALVWATGWKLLTKTVVAALIIAWALHRVLTWMIIQ